MGDLSFRWTEIDWRVPTTISGQQWDKLNIYRSETENVDYSTIATVDATGGSGSLLTTYRDTSTTGSKTKYYLVTYSNTAYSTESQWLSTVFGLVPREVRLIGFIRAATPPVINQFLTDYDYRAGLLLSLQLFNLTPPLTNFSMDTFPENYEMFLKWGGLYMAALSQSLNISIRDFTYSVPGGLGLNIDRGSKINAYLDRYINEYQKMLTTVKMNFASKGAGLGSIPLGLSLGGSINSRLLNILDITKMSI